MKDDKYGHGLVFNIVQDMLGAGYMCCEALPLEFVLTPDKKNDTDAFMKAT